MSFQKILCAIDFSPGSNQALRIAVQLALRAGGAELVVAHAWYAGDLPLPPATVEPIVGDARRGLDAAVADAHTLGASRVRTRLLTGPAAQVLVEELEHDPAFDLVVVGTHGRTGLSRVLLGSIAETIVRHAPCPVLVTRANREAIPFRRVLCPVDFSEASQQALELVANVVDAGGEIVLFHAIELPTASASLSPLFEHADRLAIETKRRLEDYATTLRTKVDVPVTTRVTTGRVGAAVLDMLDEPFDLVVTGSHGRTGLRRALLGSVAEKLVRHAPCPVLVARV